MKKILIADDNKFLTNAYKVKLEALGYEVITAADGQQALDSLDQSKPDLLLLDLIMPVKDGFTVLKEIKDNESLKELPVIILSSLGQQEDIDKAIKLGATQYIYKDHLSLDDLVKKIKPFLDQS